MKKNLLFLVTLLPISITVLAEENKQAQLDAACEDARQQKIIPKRQSLIEECQKKNKDAKADCENEFANYGARQGNRAPLYYDLPACEKAADNKSSYRQTK